jgi:hypothetical protein
MKFKTSSYCVGGRHTSPTINITGAVSSKGGKYLIGQCSQCNRKKALFVSDNTIEGEGLGDFFKGIGKFAKKNVLPHAKKLGQNVLNNPARAFELGQQAAFAAMSRNPAALAATVPQLAKFATTGKGLYLGKQR